MMRGTSRTLAPLVERYVSERRRRGEIEAGTARSQRQHLGQLANTFGARPLDQYGRRAVERWLESLEHLAPATRSMRLSTVRGFSEWLLAERLVPNLATMGVRAPRRRRHVPRDVGAEEWVRLISAATQRRTRLILWLMYGLGLRCVEVARLEVDDYDPIERTVIVKGKGSHERSIPVPIPVAGAIDAYLRAEGHRGGPLVRSELDPSRGITNHRISGLVRKVFIVSGVKHRNGDGRSAHALRAAAASDVVDETGDPRLAQQLLGHASLSTTSIYMRKVSQRRLREALEHRWAA